MVFKQIIAWLKIYIIKQIAFMHLSQPDSLEILRYVLSNYLLFYLCCQ